MRKKPSKKEKIRSLQLKSKTLRLYEKEENVTQKWNSENFISCDQHYMHDHTRASAHTYTRKNIEQQNTRRQKPHVIKVVLTR